jgi:NAD(P)-dependent dehydrogenase (short-subunit alcohol dehydrogenase family)
MSPSSKTIIITGATSGIGLALARQLHTQGCNVIGIGRSTERCQQAQRALSNVNPHTHLTYLLADLSLQVQIHKLAGQIKQQLASWQIAYLDGLVNNAATLPFHQTITMEGYDTQWAVNYLSGFLLTNLLLPYMDCAPAARIVSVSSLPITIPACIGMIYNYSIRIIRSGRTNIPNWHRCYSSMN